MKWQRALALGTAAVAAFTLVALASRGSGDATRTASSGSEVLSDGDGDFATVVALASPARVRPDVSLDRWRVLAHEREEVIALVSFQIDRPVHVERDRPQLDLGLVIDRSGSMSDKGKITHAREAAFRLVDAMAPSDVLSVVEYDDEIHVLWPASRLSSPDAVKRLIAQLEPRGSTNLAGGLFRGIDEVNRNATRAGINRVLLFSDGLANQGITSPREIASYVREARSHGITVSTLGLGLDYNEDLMQTIAEAGGGNYYFVESPAQMPQIFERELSTLFATVAKDVRLHFEFGRGVRKAEALGYDAVAENGSLTVPLENLYGGETRTILLRLELDPQEPGRMDFGELQFDYTDCESNAQENVTYLLRGEATADQAEVTASVDNLVAAEATLMEAEKEHEESVRQYESGNKDAAKQNLADLSSKLTAANEVFQDERLAKKLEQLQMEADDMDRADLSVENRQSYLKGSKNRLYNSMKGKRGQYMLQEQDAGFEVEQLQTKLQELQLYGGPVDGIYSDAVRKAVETFQTQNGLTTDGIAGPATLRSLGLY